MNLTNAQNKVVKQLFHEYVCRDMSNNNTTIIDFKAPTGSGKTFMGAHLISRILAYNSYPKTMVVIATVSNAELPAAFAKKLNDYKKYLPFNKFNVEYRVSPSSAKNNRVEAIKSFDLKHNEVLVFGTSSFGKKKLFTEQGILDNFITEAKSAGWDIIYIRDEAHKGGVSKGTTKEKDYKTFEDKIQDLATFVVRMTATPKGKDKLIELTHDDLRDDNGRYLLKQISNLNPFSKELDNYQDLLKEAIRKFKKIQDEYGKLDEFIRPAMLIQVKSKTQHDTEHDEYIKNIIKIITDKGLTHLKYFSGKEGKEGNAREDMTLAAASKKDSNVDVIIFKVGPATGWDIPRACMLVQIREVYSEVLNIQTVGRIMRNPLPDLRFNKITDEYYLYSNFVGESIIKSYRLKEKFIDYSFLQGNTKLPTSVSKHYFQEFDKWFTDNHDTFRDEILKKLKNQETLKIKTQNFASSSGSYSYSTEVIESSIKLRLWIDRFTKSHHEQFPKKIIETIIKPFAKDNFISLDELIFLLVREHLSEIQACYKKSYDKPKLSYEMQLDKQLVNPYDILISRDEPKTNKVDVTKLINYGYQLMPDTTENIQVLDSTPEKCFLEQLIDEINQDDEYAKNIDFVAKLPNRGAVYFEYWNSNDSAVKRSYTDFALVYKKEHFLMVEVKGYQDYDPSKTSDLQAAYQEYETKNSKLKMAVCYAGQNKSSVGHYFDHDAGQTKEKNIGGILKTWTQNINKD